MKADLALFSKSSLNGGYISILSLRISYFIIVKLCT